MAIILSIIFSWLLISPCFAEESYTLDRIVVKSGGDSGEGNLPEGSHTLQTITAAQIKEKNLNSLVDLMEYVAGMDLRYRGAIGVQGDLSLRGSTYEQVSVSIDGIKVMDPQTGHHNLDIPLTVYDVERVEVVKEGDSSLYGAGAFAGSVNIITKKPEKRSLNLDALFGENALFGQGLSFGLPAGDLSARVSFDNKVSKAARPNTDFEYKTGSFYLNYDAGGTVLDTLFGYQQKDFGADSFYSNLFPEEEEHTRTYFGRLGFNSRLGQAAFKNNLFLRKHRDKFILRRNNPTSVNYHTTYIYGFNSDLSLPTRYGELLLGIDTTEEEINSTNLGKHSRLSEAASLGFIFKLPERLTADLRARLDHYKKWGEQASYNLGAGYQLTDNLRLSGSLSHAFRIPTFTDLYYSDAANKGDLNLKEEKSDNFRMGIGFKKGPLELSADGFLRRGRNLIDWTRASTLNPWQATNLGRVYFLGVEFSSKLKMGLNLRGARLDKAAFSYNYTSADKKASGFFSKYALDILKHQYILEIYSGLFGLDLNWQLSYNERYYSEKYFVGNIYLGKKLKIRDFSLEPFVKVDNFTNENYTEVSGVQQPGRWIKSGFKFEW